MKDTQQQTNEQLTYERKQELIENIRQAFFRLIDENPDELAQFDREDIDKIKQFNWTIERHLMNTNWKHELAFKNMIENLKWRKDFGVNQLTEKDFPAEFYLSGSFFDYGTDKLGHSMIYIRGRMHRKISDWTPLFKKFFVYIVNKVENDVYFNPDRINKPNKENINQENLSNGIISNADEDHTKRRASIRGSFSKTAEHNRLNGFSVFWDCNGAGLANVDMDILNFMVKTITNNFPLGITHVYIFELPWILQAVLSIVRSWIPEYYLNAIVLVKKNDLQDYFDTNKLPSYLNGKCENKYSVAPKNCMNAEQIGSLNGISASNVKRLQKHIESYFRIFQHSWEALEIEQKITTIQISLNKPVDKARFSANSFEETGAWLQALPSPQLGTYLSNDEFRISVSLRLGLEIVQPHRCGDCGSKVDKFGRHGLSCTKASGTRPRHETVNDLIQRSLKSAEVPAVREPPGCSRSDGKKPDGLTLVPWEKGKCLLWDYTCADTFAQSYVQRTSCDPGYAAKRAEAEKYRHYTDLMDKFIFVPVASETSGIFSPVALQFLKKIGSKITRVTNEKRATSFLIQRIAVAIQRGNVASILGTLPPSKNLGEIFYL